MTITFATLDFAHAQYAAAMIDVRAGVQAATPWWRRPCLHRAARWSVTQWAAATLGFVVAVRVSMWLLPFEAVGLYIGTLLGGGTSRIPPEVDRA